MKIRVKNQMGNGKEVKLGFSWTFFFFSLLVPLIRGDFKWFFVLIGSSLILGTLGLPYIYSIVHLAFPFFYNKLYAKDLYDKGYRGMTAEEDELFRSYISG